jgi:hypothetical protein
MRPLVAHCAVGLANLEAAFGDKAKACAELQRAIAMYRDMDMQSYLALANDHLN